MTNLVETIQGKYELSENDGKIYKYNRRKKRFPKREINEKIFEKKESESDMIRFLIYLDVIAIK